MTLESLILLALIVFGVVFVNFWFMYNRSRYVKVDSERKGVIIATLLDLPDEELNDIYNKVQERVIGDV